MKIIYPTDRFFNSKKTIYVAFVMILDEQPSYFSFIHTLNSQPSYKILYFIRTVCGCVNALILSSHFGNVNRNNDLARNHFKLKYLFLAEEKKNVNLSWNSKIDVKLCDEWRGKQEGNIQTFYAYIGMKYAFLLFFLVRKLIVRCVCAWALYKFAVFPML